MIENARNVRLLCCTGENKPGGRDRFMVQWERGCLKEYSPGKGWNPEHRRGLGLLVGSETFVLLRMKGKEFG